MQSSIANNPSLLRNLKELRDEGLITDVEFSVEKAKLLAHMPVGYSPGFDTPGLDACCNYNFIATFDRTGSNMTCDGSLDHKIKLSGLEDFSFTVDDAKRDAATGLFVEEEQDIDVSNVQVEVDDNAADEDGEDQEVFSENGDGSESEDGGATTDGEEGPPYECDDGFRVVDECPTTMEGMQIAHRFECGIGSLAKC